MICLGSRNFKCRHILLKESFKGDINNFIILNKNNVHVIGSTHYIHCVMMISNDDLQGYEWNEMEWSEISTSNKSFIKCLLENNNKNKRRSNRICCSFTLVLCIFLSHFVN